MAPDLLVAELLDGSEVSCAEVLTGAGFAHRREGRPLAKPRRCAPVRPPSVSQEANASVSQDASDVSWPGGEGKVPGESWVSSRATLTVTPIPMYLKWFGRCGETMARV